MPNHDNNNERISSLETSTEGLHGELSDLRAAVRSEFVDIRDTLKAIQDSLSRAGKTNWSVVFAGVMVVGALYAAAIRPLNQEIERQERNAGALAIAVLEKEKAIAVSRTDISKIEAILDEVREKQREIYERGSPFADKRLTVLEYRLNQIQGEKK